MSLIDQVLMTVHKKDEKVQVKTGLKDKAHPPKL